MTLSVAKACVTAIAAGTHDRDRDQTARRQDVNDDRRRNPVLCVSCYSARRLTTLGKPSESAGDAAAAQVNQPGLCCTQAKSAFFAMPFICDTKT